jgi:hypothetical protein
MTHPLVEAFQRLLTEVVINQGIIDIRLVPGFTPEKLIIRLDIYFKATTTGTVGFREKEKGRKGREGEWHMLDPEGKRLSDVLKKSDKRPDRLFIAWLRSTLEEYGLNPQQPRQTPGFERPEETDIKDQQDIEIDRLLTHAKEVPGVTDEQKFDAIIQKAPKDKWFWIEGSPEIGYWQVVTKVDEPWEQEHTKEIEAIQKEKEAEHQKSKEKAVFDFMGVVNRLAEQNRTIPHIMLLAVQTWLEKLPGYSRPFDISAVNLEEAKRALEEISGLTFQDVEQYVSGMEGKAEPEAIGPMRPLTEPEPR